MPVYAWATDLHYCTETLPLQQAFFGQLASRPLDGLFLTGDISDEGQWEAALTAIRRAVSCPIYFVLGNHDSYHTSIAKTRAAVERWVEGQERVYYLNSAPTICIADDVVLIGEDGWGDARSGDYAASLVTLRDSLLIEELKGLDREELQQELFRLGDESAGRIAKKLIQAFSQKKSAILLTHAPPFGISCLYDGQVADPRWLPFFVCQALGDQLLAAMQERPECRLLVLCGHSHEEADVHVLPNLRVITGKGVVEGVGVERWLDLGQEDWKYWMG